MSTWSRHRRRSREATRNGHRHQSARARVRIKKDTHALHELLARYANFLGEGGGEHHDLLLVGSGPEDLLDIAAHVWDRVEVSGGEGLKLFDEKGHRQ